jgi:zinc-finger of transposase IS204/IS1001/IS1096/IS1165
MHRSRPGDNARALETSAAAVTADRAATRLVGLDGLVVTGVQRVGEQLDLQVELLARAACCPHCGGSELRVKERPRVRVRDLPIAGRVTGWCGASAATAAPSAGARSPRPMSGCLPVSG